MIPLLEAKKVSKIFKYPKPVEIFSSIDFKLMTNQAIAVMGPSGEGKTTLLQILASIEKPDSGELFFNNVPFSKLNLPFFRNQSIGFIFQSFNLMEDLTALENILLPLLIYKKKNSSQTMRAYSLLEKVHMTHRMDYPVRLLSGGEKQRIAIARSLMNDPSIILADEPSGNLDHQTALEIHNLLISLTREHQKSLVIVTHNENLAKKCDALLILKNGMLKQI